MNDKMKMGLIGLAVVVAIAGGVFAYQKANPSTMNAYDPAHAGPPAYMKAGGDKNAYGASVGGKNAQTGTTGGAPAYAGGGRGSAPPGPGGRPSYAGPRYDGFVTRIVY